MERISENEAGQSCIFIFLIFVALVAVNGNRKDKYVVKWALKKFVPNLKLLNRICKIHEISGTIFFFRSFLSWRFIFRRYCAQVWID